MKKTGALAAILLVLPFLWLAPSHAADPGNGLFNDALSKQEEIYRSRGEQRPEGYIVDRSLASYMHTLSAAFGPSLANLGATDRWLDIGAGRGQAILDYFAGKYDALYAGPGERRGSKAQAVAMSIEDRRTALWHEAAASLGADRIQYLCNKRLREYAPAELGRFQVITDVVGGFSYTSNLSQFMEKVLGLLEPGGNFFTVLQDVHGQDAMNAPYYEGSPYLTEIADARGSEVKVCSWLKSISCVEVACELKPAWQPPIEVFHVRKVCNEVVVPALVTIHYEAGTPPERGFRLAN